MPGDRGKTKAKRMNNARSAGKVRKRKLRHGTTPPFPIHPEGKAPADKDTTESGE